MLLPRCCFSKVATLLRFSPLLPFLLLLLCLAQLCMRNFLSYFIPCVCNLRKREYEVAAAATGKLLNNNLLY